MFNNGVKLYFKIFVHHGVKYFLNAGVNQCYIAKEKSRILGVQTF